MSKSKQKSFVYQLNFPGWFWVSYSYMQRHFHEILSENSRYGSTVNDSFFGNAVQNRFYPHSRLIPSICFNLSICVLFGGQTHGQKDHSPLKRESYVFDRLLVEAVQGIALSSGWTFLVPFTQNLSNFVTWEFQASLDKFVISYQIISHQIVSHQIVSS